MPCKSLKYFTAGFLLLALVLPSISLALEILPGKDHVKYYGFYGQGYATNQLVEGSVNVAFADSVSDVDKNAQSGIASIWLIQHVFFYDDKWPNEANHVPLRADAQERWEEVVRLIESRMLNGKIIGFYLYGEPYSNRAALGIPKEQTYEELRKAAKIIKNSFTYAKVLVVEQADSATPSVQDGPQPLKLFPPEVDWVGFDCYGDTFETCGGKGIPHYFNQIKSGLHPNQKIVLVPQIFAYTNNPTTADQDYIIELNKKYLSMAQASPEVVAMIGFIAANYREPNSTTQFWGGLEEKWGALDNTKVRKSLLENGRTVLGRSKPSSTPTPTPTPSTPPAPSNPKPATPSTSTPSNTSSTQPPATPSSSRSGGGGGGGRSLSAEQVGPIVGSPQSISQLTLRVALVNVLLTNFLRNKPVGAEYDWQLNEMFKEVLQIQLEVAKLIQSGVH